MIDMSFDSTWRDQIKDSEGNNLRISWFLMTSEAFRHTTQGINAVPDIFLEHFASNARSFGDEVGWHYHHCGWFESENRRGYGCHPIETFDNSTYGNTTDRQLAAAHLSAFIYKNRLYPAIYRAGWIWENTDFSNWLDSLIPFDYSHNWEEVNPLLDRYHPSAQDLYMAGDQARTIVRSFDPTDWERVRRAFEQANTGEDVIISYYTHNYGSTYVENNPVQRNAEKMHELLTALRREFGVPFRYVGASEALRAVQFKGLCPAYEPSIRVDGRGRNIRIIGDVETFGVPIICFQYSSDRYGLEFMQKLPDNQGWRYRLDYDTTVSYVIATVSRRGATFVSDRFVLIPDSVH
ncbi:MAG: hypothetical protein ACE5FH_03380 [Candidatus Zixiibacteriota bacterium]